MKALTLIAPAILCSAALFAAPQDSSTAPKPDNSAVNRRDRDPGEVTADKQKTNASDQQLTQNIRRSIMADKALSTDAHNIKIVSQNGAVTLKGPVKSADEKASVISKAVAVLGDKSKITDQISIEK
jgi:hyperosmotically inducible periplasmic protein